jgi:hypothetical protein
MDLRCIAAKPDIESGGVAAQPPYRLPDHPFEAFREPPEGMLFRSPEGLAVHRKLRSIMIDNNFLRPDGAGKDGGGEHPAEESKDSFHNCDSADAKIRIKIERDAFAGKVPWRLFFT